MQPANTLDTHDILCAWQNYSPKTSWAMAIIVDCQGHSYRKRGAFTLINQNGEQLGVLSGGCLEADIRLMARKCLSLQKVMVKEYDGRDENDAAYQMGCGGIVWVKFIPLNESNHHLNLAQVLHHLEQRETVQYGLDLAMQLNEIRSSINAPEKAQLNIEIKPKIHLLICGGGKDASPVALFAKQLGWQVSVWDPRAAYANKADFATTDTLIKSPHTELLQYATQHKVNFAVLMSHSLELDAQALSALAYSDINHISILGPKQRFNAVVAASGVDKNTIKTALSGPAGLDIGGDLPSSIALSIVAKFHALAFNKS